MNKARVLAYSAVLGFIGFAAYRKSQLAAATNTGAADMPSLYDGFLSVAYSISDNVQNAFDGNFMGKWVDLLNSKGADYRVAFLTAEQKYNLPNGLLARLAYQESRYNPDAYNAKSGATGLMQIVPRWHPNVDATDPYASIDYAGRFLAQLYKQTGTWELALKAYNWGLGNVRKWMAGKLKQPTETRLYSAHILTDLGIA